MQVRGRSLISARKRIILVWGYKPYDKKGALVPAKDRVRSIQEVFLNTGFVHGDQVGEVEYDTKDEEVLNLIYRCEAP